MIGGAKDGRSRLSPPSEVLVPRYVTYLKNTSFGALRELAVRPPGLPGLLAVSRIVRLEVGRRSRQLSFRAMALSFIVQLLLSLAIATLLSELMRGQHGGSSTSSLATECALLPSRQLLCSGPSALTAAALLLSLLLYIAVSRDHEPSARSEEWRAAITAASFALLAYTEASLKMGGWLPAARFLRAAARMAPRYFCCVFPAALIALGFIFLVIGSCIQGAGGDVRILDRPIYAFVLYGPFASVYMVLKWELEHQEAQQSALPI